MAPGSIPECRVLTQIEIFLQYIIFYLLPIALPYHSTRTSTSTSTSTSPPIVSRRHGRRLGSFSTPKSQSGWDGLSCRAVAAREIRHFALLFELHASSRDTADVASVGEEGDAFECRFGHFGCLGLGGDDGAEGVEGGDYGWVHGLHGGGVSVHRWGLGLRWGWGCGGLFIVG